MHNESHPPEPGSNVGLTAVSVPFSNQSVSLVLPQNPYALGDDLRNDGANIYWAALWPSALALAEAILKRDITLRAGALLEVGCGTGLTSIAAALSDLSDTALSVHATDIEPRALELTRANAERNGVGSRIRTSRLDWRDPLAQKYRTILAADCLYETGAAAQLSQFLRAALEPGADSRAIVVDPERHTARNFQYALREAGFQVRTYLRTVPFVLALGPLGGLEAEKLFKGHGNRPAGTAQVRFFEISY